jgi:hypothetical protein
MYYSKEVMEKATSYSGLLLEGAMLGAAYVLSTVVNSPIPIEFSLRWALIALCEIIGGVLVTILFGRAIARVTLDPHAVLAALLLGGLVVGPYVARAILLHYL